MDFFHSFDFVVMATFLAAYIIVFYLLRGSNLKTERVFVSIGFVLIMGQMLNSSFSEISDRQYDELTRSIQVSKSNAFLMHTDLYYEDERILGWEYESLMDLFDTQSERKFIEVVESRRDQ